MSEDENETAEQKISAYQEAVRTARLCAQLLSAHDIPQLLRDIERADAVGPMLDPTLWKRKRHAMEQDRDLLRAAVRLRLFGLGAAPPPAMPDPSQA